MRTGILNLAPGSRTKVFRHTVQWMKNDETLSSAIKTWMVWDGSKISPSHRPELSSMVPILRMEPSLGAMSWYDPSSQFGPLIVRMRVIIKSWNADDYLNLWEAIENSIYPAGQPSRRDLFQQQLRDLGAVTGEWTFAVPAASPDPPDDDGMFACDGMMKIDVVRTFNP